MYYWALFEDNVHSYVGWKGHKHEVPKPDLTLLRVCRQVSQEAAAMFYRINTFEFEWTFDISRFSRSLSSRNLNGVRSIRVQPESVRSLVDGMGGNVAAFTLPSLEELRVRGPISGWQLNALLWTRLRADGKPITIVVD